MSPSETIYSTVSVGKFFLTNSIYFRLLICLSMTNIQKYLQIEHLASAELTKLKFCVNQSIDY